MGSLGGEEGPGVVRQRENVHHKVHLISISIKHLVESTPLIFGIRTGKVNVHVNLDVRAREPTGKGVAGGTQGNSRGENHAHEHEQKQSAKQHNLKKKVQKLAKDDDEYQTKVQ